MLIMDLGLTQGVQGRTPIFSAVKVSFRVSVEEMKDTDCGIFERSKSATGPDWFSSGVLLQISQ